MTGTPYCSYCGNPNLAPFMIKYYKCQNCGRIVTNPIIVPDSVTPVVEAE